MRKSTALLAILLVLAVQFSVLLMPAMHGNSAVQLCPMHAMMTQSTVADINQSQNQTNNQDKQSTFCPFCSARAANFIAPDWVSVPFAGMIVLYSVPAKRDETIALTVYAHNFQPRAPPKLS